MRTLETDLRESKAQVSGWTLCSRPLRVMRSVNCFSQPAVSLQHARDETDLRALHTAQVRTRSLHLAHLRSVPISFYRLRLPLLICSFCFFQLAMMVVQNTDRNAHANEVRTSRHSFLDTVPFLIFSRRLDSNFDHPTCNTENATRCACCENGRRRWKTRWSCRGRACERRRSKCGVSFDHSIGPFFR